MKDNKEKGCNPTDQSMGNNRSKTFKFMLSENEDISNNEVYDISTYKLFEELEEI